MSSPSSSVSVENVLCQMSDLCRGQAQLVKIADKIKKHRYMLYIQYIYIWFHNIKITIERDECTSHCSALDIVVDA